MGLELYVLLRDTTTDIPHFKREPGIVTPVPMSEYFTHDCDITRIEGVAQEAHLNMPITYTKLREKIGVHEQYFHFVYLGNRLIAPKDISQFYGSLLPPNFITGVIVTKQPFDYRYLCRQHKSISANNLAHIAQKHSGFVLRVQNGEVKRVIPTHRLRE
jgi:hypothetical protein